MKHYLSEISAVYTEVTSGEAGLSSAEAEARLAKNGKNKLAEAKKVPLWKRFLSQMTDPMIIILLVAAVVSSITEYYEAASAGVGFFPTDAVIILFVVLVNAILGVYQESKAEAAIEALQKMSAATSRVIRDGKTVSVKSEDLVVGDIILLEAGDAVPADCRVIEAASLKIEEAALTGESVPVTKKTDALALAESAADIPLGDRKNMVYMGSSVVYGRGKAVVVAIGMETEMGKIADAIAKAEDGETPLQIKLSQLSKILSWLVLGICVFIFAFRLVYHFGFGVGGETLGWLDFSLDSFMIAVSLAVAAIPEGLVAVVTIVLSIGVTNMSKQNAIIRKLTAVETLGCAQIICSDKTGTLTQNKMTVVEYSGDDEKFLATAMSLCTDADIDKSGKTTGDPTQTACVAHAFAVGLFKPDMLKEQPRVGEIPFDSGRKMMTTLHALPTGKFIQYTTGAPDVIISRCDRYTEGGKVLPMTEEKRNFFYEENHRLASKALRVLGGAYKEHDAKVEMIADESEKNLIMIGLVGMIDPVRPEVKGAIDTCRSAGIRPIMITGDHLDTAAAIAKQIGIITDSSEAITGASIDGLSDEELAASIEKYGVYARVQPEHKVRIVNAWRNRGMITAMTGDGVNDAPSIKSADIGVGMGITGTDVTKNVADMVLADDNFATIVSAVSEGRRIYDNIRKAIQFLLGSNLAEVLSIFVATVMNFTILKPTHLLFINLVTDCVPAIALGMEKPERDIMEREPRKATDGIFANGMGADVIYQGVIVTLLSLAAFFLGEYMSLPAGEVFHWTNIADCADGMTMAFLTMSMCEIFHSFNMRSQRRSSFGMTISGSHNPLLYGAMLLSLLLTTAVIYVPFLSSAFGFTEINLTEYSVALGLAFLVIPIVEAVKAFQRAAAKKKQ